MPHHRHLATAIRLAIASSALVAAVAAGADVARAAGCDPAADLDAAALEQRFADGVAGIAGADYQRAIELPDGRTLWTFQDAFVTRPGRSDRLVHNVGLVQQGSCFTMVRSGTAADPRPWIGAASTDHMARWFWPLAGLVGDDGAVRIFVAEMVEDGPRYLSAARPVATWLATIDPATWSVTALEPAPDAGAQLYGWSVVPGADHTYLYGHCYRQFGAGMLGHDACAASVTVARVPGRQVDAAPEYWDGARWVADPGAAADVAPPSGPDGAARAVNPMQVARVGARWIAVTKEGDWWGTRIYLDVAASPVGPWTTTAMLAAVPLGAAEVHNTYFASLVSIEDGAAVVALSNNRWDGLPSDSYRPTFRTVPLRRWSLGQAA